LNKNGNCQVINSIFQPSKIVNDKKNKRSYPRNYLRVILKGKIKTQMRITFAQQSFLKKILTDLDMNLELFGFDGKDDLLLVRFKSDYFSFQLRKLNNLQYVSTACYVNNKAAIETKDNWEQVLSRFKHWATGIAEEIKNMPVNTQEVEEEFPIEIKKYSKNFVTIYNQSLKAEINSLTEICGLGYRKAFEFLIKDYLIKKHPKPEHIKIKELPVSRCISEYVTSDEIKLVSHRVLWLGNDHAHYLKKWKGKTLTDLKSLINLTIRWIMIKDELMRVKKQMPATKKPKPV
jgi:hypothetical protein